MKTTISIRQKALLPFYLLTFSLLFAACQDTEWDVYTPNGASLYGNSSIDDSNIVTIAQLKQMYPNVFATTDQNALVDKDLKIKGRVTANDIRGNIYKQFMMQDETGAIIVAVNESGISGYLAEGQEIIVDLKGLYVGGYFGTDAWGDTAYLGDFIVQFFHLPWIGALLVALLLTGLAAAVASFRRSDALLPLALVPSLAYAVLLCDAKWTIAGLAGLTAAVAIAAAIEVVVSP